MINIKETIESGNANTSSQAALLLREMRFSKTKTITLDFDGLESCNSVFINASIGKYYMQENKKDVRFLNVAKVWEDKIDTAIKDAADKQFSVPVNNFYNV